MESRQPHRQDQPATRTEAEVLVPPRANGVAMWLWRALALLSLGLGVLGAVLPVLPTTPFLLVSAWAASKGWPAFERWLLAHPRLGPPVRRWRDHGAVPRRAKWIASIMMVGSALILQWFSGIALWVRIAVPAMMACVAVWLWLRPDA